MRFVNNNLAGVEESRGVMGPIPDHPHNYTTVYTPSRTRSDTAYRLGKRLMDILLSSVALVALSPLLLLVGLAIRLESKGPALYAQTRIGKNNKPFTMYKFRSMCQDAEAMQAQLQEKNERDGPVFKIANDPRVTKVGAFIRKTCIDELPQLINILKGDMSLVGPRPPLPGEVEQYTPYHLQRLGVTPGLTCYWQVSNRKVSFNEWVEMDLRYIHNRCFRVDMAIIVKTFLVVFRVSGDK